MKLTVIQGNIQESSADTLIVYLFEGVTKPAGAAGAIDRVLKGALGEMIANGDFTGKEGEVGVLYPHGALAAKRVLVSGLGKQETIGLESVRRAAAAAIKKGRELNAKNVATSILGDGSTGLTPSAIAQATAEGSLLALYRYAGLKKTAETKNEIEALTLVEAEDSKLGEVQRGTNIAQALETGVTLARDLINMPPNVATPNRLAKVAEEIATLHHMNITVGDREWATQRQMGAFLAVAKGAGEPPKFIVLEHNSGHPEMDTLVLVGKGITFDTGGISLKPVEKMGEMKSDMSGAAAVLGAMQVVGILNLPLHIVGIAPCTENMPDGNAYRPADVVRASNGKTIEIITTDAEGRLVLADGLVYAQQFQPKAVIDLATLTGACVIALGDGVAAGLFSNTDSLTEKLLASAEATHERLWRMPLWDEYQKAIKSEVADMKNSGGRYGGVGTSAIFLKSFTDYPWAHIDMAGMALADKAGPYTPVGGTGYGVRLLVDFLLQWSAE